VFGSTDGASPVVVRTSARVPQVNRLELAQGRSSERRVLPHSLDRRKQFTKPAWAEGGRFTLTLATRPGQAILPPEAMAALLLLLNLGGVGKRSRRGFGSLQGIESAAQGLPEDADVSQLLSGMPEDGTALEQRLTDMLAWSRRAVSTTGGSPYLVTQIPDYPVFSDEHAKVLVCRYPFDKNHYHEAMISFWDRLRRSPYVNQQDAFGYVRGRQRRASPLFLHIAKSQAGHHLVMTALRSKPETIGSAGWKLIDDFLQERAAAWNGVFLMGGSLRW